MPNRLLTYLLPTALAALALVPTATASSGTEVLVPSGSGITAPSGAALTSDGALWIGDGEKGVCRVRLAQPRGLVRDGVWCDPDTPALDKTGQLAFDREGNFLYVAEADSAAGGIWRLRWDPATGTIASGGKIVDTPDDLITGLAVSYTGPPRYEGGPLTAELNFTSKRTNSVRRVREPDGAQPTVVTIGQRRFLGEEEVGSIAALGPDLYLAEPFGVTRLTAFPGETPRAELVPGLSEPFPAGLASAVAADPERGRVYAGTDNGNARDQVDVLEVANLGQELYDVGVAAVVAIVVEDDGDLLIVDDPSDAAGADVNDQARVWRMRFAPLGRPRASWTQLPPLFTAATHAGFGYTARAGSTFECSVDSAPWQPCGGPTSGYYSMAGLAEGSYVFRVRPVDPDPAIGVGRAIARTLVVDRTRPTVSIDNTAADRDIYSNDFKIRFSGSEPGLTFRCSLDGAPAVPCTPAYHTFERLTHGYHTVEVTAIDAAGNDSLSGPHARYHFYVHAPSPPLPPVPPVVAPLLPSPAPTATTTRTVATPKKAKKAARRPKAGNARLVGAPRSCARGAFTAYVAGRAIDRVGFRLDGRRVRIVRAADRRGRFAIRVPARRAGRHVLTALIRFDRGAGRSERLALEYRSCFPPGLGAGTLLERGGLR
ncbi:MAG TPA: hypothetical protein VHF90_06825 [Thermoleophilaceae bacterium]|nr:hypothetical protein [Thermoleophilaceae bacterium]